MSELLAAAAELPVIEWSAVVLALGYVVLAARNSPWCWPLAFVSSCLWAYQVYAAYALYFDAALNAFYAVMAIVGAVQWLRGGAGGEPLPITRLPLSTHAAWIGGGLAATGLAWVLAEAYTDAARPLADALTTVFSVIGTILLVRRVVDNWLYLLAMDLVYVWLYLERGSLLFAGLFVVYSVLAVVGYAAWLRELRVERARAA